MLLPVRDCDFNHKVGSYPLLVKRVHRRWRCPRLRGGLRAGRAAGFAFLVHPHMLRHATGYKLANDGQDTRATQHYLGHKNLQHTVRYTELNSKRFNGFWKD